MVKMLISNCSTLLCRTHHTHHTYKPDTYGPSTQPSKSKNSNTRVYHSNRLRRPKMVASTNPFHASPPPLPLQHSIFYLHCMHQSIRRRNVIRYRLQNVDYRNTECLIHLCLCRSQHFVNSKWNVNIFCVLLLDRCLECKKKGFYIVATHTQSTHTSTPVHNENVWIYQACRHSCWRFLQITNSVERRRSEASSNKLVFWFEIDEI